MHLESKESGFSGSRKTHIMCVFRDLFENPEKRILNPPSHKPIPQPSNRSPLRTSDKHGKTLDENKLNKNVTFLKI